MSPSNGIMFRNVRVFPGHGEILLGSHDVRVDGTTITSVEAAGHVAPDHHMTSVDGAGRVLMPGLIDAHWHAAFAAVKSCDVVYDG